MERPEENERILSSIEKIIRRLVRFLIGKVSYKRFESMIRQIFVEESEKYLSKENSGRRISLTRLSFVTGLDTRVLTKIKSSPHYGQPLDFSTRGGLGLSPEADLIDLWLADDRFFDAQKNLPKTLEIWGDGNSFERLVLDSVKGRGITVQSVLESLELNNSVVIDPDSGHVSLMARYWEPFKGGDSSALVEAGTNSVCKLLDTVFHNYHVSKEDRGNDAFYQRMYWSNRLSVKDIDAFRAELREFLESTAEESIQLMAGWEQNTPTENQVFAGVGFQYFESDELE